MILLLALTWAQEHALVVPATTEVAVLPVPDGVPRTERVRVGEDIQSRLAQLPAGSTLVLEAGNHRGPLHIDRSVVLIAEPGAQLHGGGSGTVLVIAAPDTVVRDLAIRGGGRDATKGDAGIIVAADRVRLEHLDIAETLVGVDFRMASHSALLDSTIRGWDDLPMGQRGDGIRLWESDDNLVQGNSLVGVRDIVVWYSEGNTVAGNRVTGSRYGTHFMHADRSVVRGNEYRDNVVGVFVMYSDEIELTGNTVRDASGAAGVGFGFKDSDRVAVTDNRLVGNTTGIYLDNTPHRVGGWARFQSNLLAYNTTGVRLHGAQDGAQFAGNEFHENAVPVSADGRADTSGTQFDGNAWSDYTGYDMNNDGIGDVPWELRAVSITLLARTPNVAYFHGTLAAGLLDLFAAAFPMFAPPAIARDPRPVLR